MKPANLPESPFRTLISFHKVIESLEIIAKSSVDYRSNYAKALLKEVAVKPEFKEGIDDFGFITENEELIKNLLADLFPTALTHNEIKAATLPFHNISFNYSERFKKILVDAGQTFDFNIRDFDEHQFYVMNCTLILNAYYNQKVDFAKPLFYDIPDADGIMRHYRILYNADFSEIFPSENVELLTDEEILELLDNYDNLALWKQKFPPRSWTIKGFVIASLIDVTVENALSNLKTFLLRPQMYDVYPNVDASSIFNSVFKVPDLQVGFTIYNEEENSIHKPPLKEDMSSFILFNKSDANCKEVLCGYYDDVIRDQNMVVLSDINKIKADENSGALSSHLLSQNIQSCLLAPVIDDGRVLGILELASSKPRALHSINATKLDLIMPFLVDTISRVLNDMQNQIDAIIQKEYTAIHPSVDWKFKQEARNYLQNHGASKDYLLKEIVFKNVYPLYGQIDIKGSSENRNESVRIDLRNQLLAILDLLETVRPDSNLIIVEQRKCELQELLQKIELQFNTDIEQHIHHYIEQEVPPLLTLVKANKPHAEKIKNYFDKLDPETGTFYQTRKDFDTTISLINKNMAAVLDAKQLEAQQIYPHYYERFKTDGVEHNLYIGESIAPNIPYDRMYLNNLRLWQLQTLCEMELEHHRIKDTLPYSSDVASLILVFSAPISIRFRMDEKRFDVDGSYNARYEVVKKRIDKAHIKGTDKRITEKEKITIVYSHQQEEAEYLKYIKYLQYKKMLEPQIEQFEVEDLQGISALKAYRVKVRTVKLPATKLDRQSVSAI